MNLFLIRLFMCLCIANNMFPIFCCQNGNVGIVKKLDQRWIAMTTRALRPLSTLRFRFTTFNPSNTQDASNDYQTLGKEAQEAFNIPSDKHINIKCIPDTLGWQADAITSPHGIFINPKKLDLLTYGQKKLILFHEVCHLKEQHAVQAERYILEMLLGTTFLSFCTHKLITKISPMFPNRYETIQEYKPLLFMGTICLALALWISRIHHPGTRADSEAIKKSNCDTCTQEFANLGASRWGQDSSTMGYLSQDERLELFKKHKKNTTCAYHMQINTK